MKALYIEAFAGVSGNMLLGALLQLGVPADIIKKRLQELALGDYDLILQKVKKCGLEAVYFNVKLPEDQGTDHDHMYEHEHMHAHEHVHTHGHRHLAEITAILKSSSLPSELQQNALAVFQKLAEAEAKVHGVPVEEVHFHEVGAIDTIIDIVGSLVALDYLGVKKIYVSPITTGYGFVRCAHGLMPVPAPATAELLQGWQQQHGNIERELTTPTGAALMRTLAEQCTDIPSTFTSERIGYGAGTWDLEIPNVLRVYLGTVAGAGSGLWQDEELHVLSCNLDNLDPQLYPQVLEQALQLGALDAWITPILMKKGRPAQMLSLLAAAAKVRDLQKLLYTDTSTLGIRDLKVQRSFLRRTLTPVPTPWGTIRVKRAFLGDQEVNTAPEYEDCRRVAQAKGVPVKKVMELALVCYREGKP